LTTTGFVDQSESKMAKATGDEKSYNLHKVLSFSGSIRTEVTETFTGVNYLLSQLTYPILR